MTKARIEVSMDRAQWRELHADCREVIEHVAGARPGDTVDGARDRYAVIRDAIEARFPKWRGTP